jgi:hypothetical protein
MKSSFFKPGAIQIALILPMIFYYSVAFSGDLFETRLTPEPDSASKSTELLQK